VRPDAEVLDRNLDRLLRACYAPRRPEPAYRARLRASFARAVAERARRAPALAAGRPGPEVSATARRDRALRLGLGLASAAAVLVVLALALRGGGERGGASSAVGDPPRLASLVEGGAVAVREGLAGPWRGAAPAELERGLALAAAALEVATPAGAGAAVRLDADGRVELAPASRARFLPPAPREPGARVLVERGSAELAGAGGRQPLPLAVEVTVVGGVPVAPRPFAPGARRPEPGARRPVEPRPAPAAEPSPAAPALLVVRASDAATGEPLDAFRVGLQLHYEAPEFTPVARWAAGAGRAVVVRSLEPGRYRLDVTAPGYAPWIDEAFDFDAPAPGAPPRELAVELDRGVRLAGRVVDARSGAPVAGARVFSEVETPDLPLDVSPAALAELELESAATDADGRFELPALSRRRHRLRAVHADFAPAWTAWLDLADELELERARHGGGPVLALRPGGSVRGRVLRADGSPWPGVEVCATRAEPAEEHPRITIGGARTDAGGEYLVEHLPPGGYAVIRLGAGGGPADPELAFATVREGEASVVHFGAESSEPASAGGARVSGSLLASGGAPLAGAYLSLLPTVAGSPTDEGMRTAVTDGQGRFEVADLEPGAYSLFVARGMGQTIVRLDGFELAAGEQLERAVAVPAGEIAGTVRDGLDDAPLAGCRVLVESLEATGPARFVARTSSGPDGGFRVPHVAAGAHRLRVDDVGGGRGQERVDLVVVEGAPDEPLAIALLPGATVRVRAVDAAGRPVAGARVAFEDADGVVASFAALDRTDAAGVHEARRVRAGRWTLRLEARGVGAATAVLDLVPGEERGLELVLAPTDDPPFPSPERPR